MLHASAIQSFCDHYMSAVEQQLALLSDQCIAVDLHAIPPYTEYLREIASEVPHRWQIGRKSMRTLVMYTAMAEIYPSDILPMSLALDALINLLDDMLDDILSREERGRRILELLRVLGWLNSQQVPPHFQEYVARYFIQCPGIVLGEDIYAAQMKTLSHMEDLVPVARHCYDAKSLDVDIFAELPLLAAFGHANHALVTLARHYRALFLINKDIQDLEWDTINQTETPVLLVANASPDQFDLFLKALAENYRKTAAEVPLFKDLLQQRIADALQEQISYEATRLEIGEACAARSDLVYA